MTEVDGPAEIEVPDGAGGFVLIVIEAGETARITETTEGGEPVSVTVEAVIGTIQVGDQSLSEGNPPIVFEQAESRLRITKVVVGFRPADRFDLLIDGVTYGDDVSGGGSTGFRAVTPGSHQVSEAAGAGTSLVNYGTFIVCSVGQRPIAFATGTSLTVNVPEGEDVSCTVTNVYKRPNRWFGR